MAYEKVDYYIRIYKNTVEIIPKDGMKDNSLYEVKIRGLKSASTLEDIEVDTIKFVTLLTPSYCNLIDVETILDVVEIEPELILYNIREASKYAEYIYEKSNGIKIDITNIPFAVREYVKYKAARDCLLKIYMSTVSNKMLEGTLGEVKFKVRDSSADLKKLLEWLDKEINKWLDAIRGYELEGRAKMATAIKGSRFRQSSLYKSNGLTDIDLYMNNRGEYD